jgi:hypothetical protein
VPGVSSHWVERSVPSAFFLTTVMLTGLAAAEVGFVDPQAPAPPDLTDLTDRPDLPVAAVPPTPIPVPGTVSLLLVALGFIALKQVLS